MSKVARSKFAVDIFFRLWDDMQSCWVANNGKSIWATRGSVDRLRDKMIEDGRNPDTLQLERVQVKIL